MAGIRSPVSQKFLYIKIIREDVKLMMLKPGIYKSGVIQ